MDIKINKEDNKTFVVIYGRIYTTTVEEFQKAANTLMEDENPDIDIDCTALSYTSSQGLRTFLMLQKSVMKHGGKMVLRNMNPQVKEVFDITGFSNIITII